MRKIEICRPVLRSVGALHTEGTFLSAVLWGTSEFSEEFPINQAFLRAFFHHFWLIMRLLCDTIIVEKLYLPICHVMALESMLKSFFQWSVLDKQRRKHDR